MNNLDKKAILDELKAISGSLSRIEAERDLIKEKKKEVCDTFQLDKKVFSKVIKAYHKGNKDEEKALFTEFEELYDEVSK